MTRLDSLPPDQRAALALLLNQQRGYSDVARLRRWRGRAGPARAPAALAVLAPREARELPAERRLEVGDYLLGQRSSVADSLRTRSYLDASPQARKWAKAIAAELAPLSAGPLPEIPGAAPSGNGSGSAAAQPASVQPAASPSPQRADGTAGGPPPRRPPPAPPGPPRPRA